MSYRNFLYFKNEFNLKTLVAVAIKYLERVAQNKDFKNTTDSFFKSYALLNLAETYILKGDTVNANDKLLQLQDSLNGFLINEKNQIQKLICMLFLLN